MVLLIVLIILYDVTMRLYHVSFTCFRFKFLLYEETSPVPETAETSLKLLEASNIDPDKHWEIGRTKVKKYFLLLSFYLLKKYRFLHGMISRIIPKISRETRPHPLENR